MNFSPFCDYLSVTVPADNCKDFRYELTCFLSMHGAHKDDRGIFRFLDCRGSVVLGKRGKVLTAGFSGSVLSHLRDFGLYGELLLLLSNRPHRVTRLDAALDVYGEGVADKITALYLKAKRGGIRFTRKALDPAKAVRKLWGPDDRGIETGTLYLGKSGVHEVYAKVYDKRWQRCQVWGMDSPDCLRYEITVSGKMGPTLRDAADPTQLFWHFAGGPLLPAPANVAPWHGYGEGFKVDHVVDLLPFQALQRRIEDSPEVEDLIMLADRLGPSGSATLSRLLTQRLEGYRSAQDSSNLGGVAAQVSSGDLSGAP